MIGPTETTSTRYLAWDFPFHPATIVLVMVGCASLMLWTLYRERHVLGSGTTSLFVVLRVLGIATVLWMLLAPTSVVEESTSTKRAIAFVTDVSASMSTLDPKGSSDELRWKTAQSDAISGYGEAVALSDRAEAAIGIAYRELEAAVQSLQQHGSQELVTAHVGLASDSVSRSRDHLASIRQTVDQLGIQDSESESVQGLVNRLLRLVDSPEFESLQDLAETLERGSTPTELGWRESLPDLMDRSATAQRVFQELSSRLVTLGDQTESRRTDEWKMFAGQPRGERVAAMLRQAGLSSLVELQEKADIKWTTFDGVVQDLTGADETVQYLKELSDREDLVNRTDLSVALKHIERMQQTQPVAAAFVLTDVAHNSDKDQSPLEIAAQLNDTPVYVIPIGNPSRLRDVDLVAVSAPSVAMRNDDVVIEAQLEAYQCLGETCLVQLLRDGEAVDFRNVTIDSDAASRRVRFDQRVADVGLASFQIAIAPLDGEMTTDNNFDEIEINVTRSDIKVLLADELPRWEYRYLAQLFRRDSKIELDELLFRPRLIATGRRESTGSFPITVDDWDQYDVVILGDLSPDRFSAASQESLIQYVRTRGGTVILIAGRRAMPAAYQEHPLAEVIPVRPVDQLESSSGYAFRVTQLGESHVALMIGETEKSTKESWDFVNRFSPLNRVSEWRDPLPAARSLIAAVPKNSVDGADAAEGRHSTFLCWQPVGRGRLVYLSGPETYRLRFLRGDRLHYRFWGQLMRWAIASDLASGNQLVRIRSSKTLYQTKDSVDVEVILFDSEGAPIVADTVDQSALHLSISSPDEQRIVPLARDDERPGFYRAEVNSIPPGVYQAQPAGTLVEALMAGTDIEPEGNPEEVVATFTVQADLPAELVDTRVNRVLATQISELTGGQVLPPTAVSEILELTNLDPVVTHRVQRQPLWLRWRYLWLVFGCLQTEWIVRKWRGLS
ncbi:MAG: hypothetical protein AAGG48_05355 [Planctomycetota bacterium]